MINIVLIGTGGAGEVNTYHNAGGSVTVGATGGTIAQVFGGW